MEAERASPDFSGLTRRDFLKFLPTAAGALLLHGCVGPMPSVVSPTTSHSLSVSLANATQTISPIPQPSDTFTLIPEYPPEYLPAVDGTFSVFPLSPAKFPTDMPLMQALQKRHSSRTFRTDELPVSVIADLLWAGFGVNRPDGQRTAPSAYNVQDIDIYLATRKGLLRYEATDHSLTALLPDDLRSFTGTQDFVSTVPLNLVYVSDYSRINASAEDRLSWSWAHTGCIAQNVYLACAALGLATVVRSTLDRSALGARMRLNENQRITLTQSIGYPL